MYLLLLGFGVVLSIAGIALAATGLSIREGSFDAGLVTPGIVSAVGGLLLIGLGLALRTLQRIEQALAARVMPRVAPGQIAGASETTGHVGGPGLFPLPIQKSPAPQPTATAARAPDDQPATGAAEKLPEAVRVANRPLPPLPKIAASAGGNEANAATDAEQPGKRGNGVAAVRISPRLPLVARSTAPAEAPKASAFNASWSKGPERVRSAQPGPARAAAPAAVEPQHSAEQIPETVADTSVQEADGQSSNVQQTAVQVVSAQAMAAQTAADHGAAAPISVLKSGVVDGMAYTLYSDGSIEAQLPQGTLRFGSLTELRHHLERSA